jgi:hypothetical protein
MENSIALFPCLDLLIPDTLQSCGVHVADPPLRSFFHGFFLLNTHLHWVVIFPLNFLS